jgi:hypothetical protein
VGVIRMVSDRREDEVIFSNMLWSDIMMRTYTIVPFIFDEEL